MKKFIFAIIVTLTFAGFSFSQMMGEMHEMMKNREGMMRQAPYFMQPYYYYYYPSPYPYMMPMPHMVMGMPMMHMMMPMMGMGPMMPHMMMQNPIFIERMLYMLITKHPEAFKEALKRNPELKRKLEELVK